MLKSNHEMINETKEMAKETKETRQQAYRPEVIAFIRHKEEELYFQIKNIGTRPAFNISIEIEQFFSDTLLEGKRFFNQNSKQGKPRDVEKKIYLLAPDQEVETYMGVRGILARGDGDLESCVKIIYSNSEEQQYTEEYTLSLSDFIDIELPSNQGITGVVEELSKLRLELSKK